MAASEIAAEYNEVIDRKSAYEMLKGKLVQEEMPEQEEKVEEEKPEKESASSGISDTIKAVAGSSITKTIVKELTRGLFGVLFGTPARKTTRRRKNSLF